MSGSPGPHLVGHHVERGQLILELADRTHVPIEASVERLELLLGNPMAALEAGRTIEVLTDSLETTAKQWEAISRLLRPHFVAGSPRISRLLGMSHEALAGLPQRVYGGTAMQTTLYLSLPVNFKRCEDGRLRALLNDGQRIWKTWVNPVTEEVQIETGEVPGHFVS